VNKLYFARFDFFVVPQKSESANKIANPVLHCAVRARTSAWCSTGSEWQEGLDAFGKKVRYSADAAAIQEPSGAVGFRSFVGHCLFPRICLRAAAVMILREQALRSFQSDGSNAA
jgi:hypothetical protein